MAESLLQKLIDPKRVFLWLGKLASRKYEKKLRKEEYRRIAKPFDKESVKMKNLMGKMLSDYNEYIRKHGPDSLYPMHSAMNVKKMTLLYGTIKKLKPDICVETGVANGFSTAAILLALKENKKGKLYSIDICYKPTGVLIPDKLKDRWVLIKGFIRPELKRLVDGLEKINFFLHDGSHTFRDMMFDYETSWAKMPKKSVLVSDDVSYNDAFLDFSDHHDQRPIILETDEKFIGILNKR